MRCFPAARHAGAGRLAPRWDCLDMCCCPSSLLSPALPPGWKRMCAIGRGQLLRAAHRGPHLSGGRTLERHFSEVCLLRRSSRRAPGPACARGSCVCAAPFKKAGDAVQGRPLHSWSGAPGLQAYTVLRQVWPVVLCQRRLAAVVADEYDGRNGPRGLPRGNAIRCDGQADACPLRSVRRCVHPRAVRRTVLRRSSRDAGYDCDAVCLSRDGSGRRHPATNSSIENARLEVKLFWWTKMCDSSGKIYVAPRKPRRR